MEIFRRVKESVLSGIRFFMRPWKRLYRNICIEHDGESWRALSIYLSILLSCVILIVVYAGFVLSIHNPNDPALSAIMKRDEEIQATSEVYWNSVGFCIPVVLAYSARLINRAWVLDKFRLDDICLSFTLLIFSGLIALLNASEAYETNLYPASEESTILANSADVAGRILGSKIVAANEQAMLWTIWCARTCTWLFLLRLYRSLPRYEMTCYFLMFYFWIGLFVSLLVFFFGPCVSFSRYWSVPLHDPQCASYQIYSIVRMVFNVSSDLLLILMALPLVWASQLPTKRKFVVALIFGLAIFKIVCATMNARYLGTSPSQTTMYKLWYIREASVSIVIPCLIGTWQLWQRLFHLTSFTNTSFSINDDGALSNNHGLRHRVLTIVRYCCDTVRNPFGGGIDAQAAARHARAQADLEANDTELEERQMWQGRDTRRDTGFSILNFAQDEEVRPAIMYRSMHNIV